MSRILITGATGFIGRHLVSTLLAQGTPVSALVRPSSASRDVLPPEVAVVAGDLSDAPEALAAAFSASGATAVVHLASLLKAPWRTAFTTLNVEGTRRVAQATQAAGARLVVVSSLAAGPRTPVSRYGRVKRAAEEAAQAACPGALVVRPPAVYGPHDRAMLPLFRAAAQGWHAIPTRPAARVSLVHVGDLADLLARVALHPAPPAEAPLYPAHPAPVGWDDLGDLLAEAAGSPNPPRRIFVPRPVMATAAWAAEGWGRLRDRPIPFNQDKWAEACAGDWICDTTTATDPALGWQPGPLRDRLAQTARWYRDAGWM